MHQEFLTVGIDVGSQTHRIAVMNPQGKIIDQWSTKHRYADFKKAAERMQSLSCQYHLPVIAGIEGYNGYASPFDEYLINQGITIKQINNLTLDRYRQLFGQPYKTDEYDAQLIASYLMQPLPSKTSSYAENRVLPSPSSNKKIKALARHQRGLIKEQTRYKNRLRKLILGYFPELFSVYKYIFSPNCLALIALAKAPAKLMVMSIRQLSAVKAPGCSRSLGKTKATILKDLLQDYPKEGFTVHVQEIIAASLARRIITLVSEIEELDGELSNLVQHHQSGENLLSVPGVGIKTAARILGESGDIARFSTPDKFCVYSGVVCLRNDSGLRSKSRNTKKVNHILKDTFFKIALTSLRVNPESQAYYQRKRREGHKHFSALKCLAHQIAKVIYKLMSSNSLYQQSYKKAA
jgi:transposase